MKGLNSEGIYMCEYVSAPLPRKKMNTLPSLFIQRLVVMNIILARMCVKLVYNFSSSICHIWLMLIRNLYINDKRYV